MLKLAVAYRYILDNSSDKETGNVGSEKSDAEDELHIKAIVKTIVKETNEKLKECNMSYEKDEIRTGILINGIVD